ncbi:MAG TPA: penicillin-binding protein 1C, partial [Candidatus Baltobacteraceae bacterium]|nr:penicillin-binding protein 1C [Candidatus Baltobacteraceae bacterium]
MQTLLRAAIGLCAALLVGLYAAGYDVARLARPHGAVTFTDRTGAPLGTILASDAAHAVAVPLRAVSPEFTHAIVSAEDARFNEHNAIDVRAIVRAARDLAIYGTVRSGASTIPMQLARLLHPVPSTMRGKFAQAFDAMRISVRSERPALLDAYVNRVPMGGNLYGVEAASRTYFGEPASDLDLAQASLLAAIPNDPSHLSPDVDMRAARARQRYVLERMVRTGAATQAEADTAARETVSVRPHDSGVFDAPHALFALFPHVDKPRVRTTIDRDLQRFVQAQTREVIADLAGRHVEDAAVLVADNRTGDVLAYVGSPDYFSDEALGRNDGVQALRQPGSSLKPFTYELALERGTIRSTTILADTPASFAVSGGKLYQPADYSGRFSGPVRVRYALANSLNVPAVRVLSILGPETLLDRLRNLGFSHLTKPASYYGLGLTLGGGEVTLWENVQAYVAMAREGDAIPLRLIDGAPVASRAIGDAPTWELIGDMLADPHARAASFGLHSVLDMPFDAAVKTGTSSDFRDTWTIGFSRSYTVGVWVGNFDGSSMRDISGVTGAGPLWNRIMLHLHEREDPPALAAPSGYARAAICATTGAAPSASCAAVVQEWVKPADLARVRVPTPGDRRFRILDPVNGATYYRNLPANALQAREQQLAFHATGDPRAVRWYVNGVRIAPDTEGNVFFPVRVGTMHVEARSGATSDAITIRIVP